MKRNTSVFALLTIFAFSFLSLFMLASRHKYLLPLKDFIFRKNITRRTLDPWSDVPDFALYLRFTSGARWEEEYKNVLIRTLKIFFPKELAKLVVVLDNEKEEDHALGRRIKKEWPYPEICYRDARDPAIYHNWGKGRMFWDMMYPDLCTSATYVGYVDTDTFFSTLVTPQLLFENGKPIVVAKIGQGLFECWAQSSELFVGQKEVLQCMSTFPVMIKTEHMKKMREVLSKLKGKDFDTHFKDSAQGGSEFCICQFSFMCNYVWYYHRGEYAWHLQMNPDGDYKGQAWPSQVPTSYYETDVKPKFKVPIPRTSIHLRYTITHGQHLDQRYPPKEIVEDFIREGLCYSAGFEYCPEKCKTWNKTKIHYNLYSFEFYQWFWDKRCMEEQVKHYANVKRMLDYYTSNNLEIFGIKTIDKLCDMI